MFKFPPLHSDGLAEARSSRGVLAGRVGSNGDPRQFGVGDRTTVSLIEPWPEQRGGPGLIRRLHSPRDPHATFRMTDLQVTVPSWARPGSPGPANRSREEPRGTISMTP